MQQLALLQAAGALSASQGRVMWPTKGWGTNRTVTVWQTMQVLSDKLTSRCVTSYLSALVVSKNDLMQQVALLQAAGALSASQGRVMWPTKGRDKLLDDWGTNRVAVWQTMQLLSHKLIGRFVTSYPRAFARTDFSPRNSSCTDFSPRDSSPKKPFLHILFTHCPSLSNLL